METKQAEVRAENRIRNTPGNAPQVSGNCDLSLNKEETLSVTGLKTRFNNPDVDQPQQQTAGLKAIVFVLSVEGNPLMPCKRAKARKLLQAKRAKVVKLYPFTVKLNFRCENQVQAVKVGIDSGYGNIGFSAVTVGKEVLAGDVVLDNKTSSRLNERRMYRRGRRNRLWYRQQRFLNRTREQGWLPPSVERKYNTHLILIEKIASILPVGSITIETANFDIQQIENPGISGTDYQRGAMYGYQNRRSYLMAREQGLCQLCKKEFNNGNPSHIHHCKQRSEQGSDRVKNLAILHEKCHNTLHEKGLKLTAPKDYKPNTFMSIINNRFKKDIPGANITFGYKTFVDRQELGLEKSHANDAFVIAGGTTQERIRLTEIRQKHRNNRAIQLNRKGFEPSVRKQRYAIQPKDLIWVDGEVHTVSGIQNKGAYVKTEASKKPFPVMMVERKYNFGGFAYAG